MSSFALNTTYKILYTFSVAVCFGFLTLNFNVAHAGLIFRAPSNLGLTQGLVGYWSFNGPDMSGNTAYDRSGNNNNGTLTNNPVRKPGKIGQALEFDGVDDYVDAGSPASLTNLGAITVSAWINPTSITNPNSGIVMKARGLDGFFEGWSFFAHNESGGGGDLVFDAQFSVTSLKTSTVYNTIINGQWQHVVVAWDGSTTAANVRFYRNGVEIAHGGLEGNVNGSGTRDNDSIRNLLIASPNVVGGFLPGLIDDVRIYNRALSADEIKRLYNMGSTLKFGKAASNQSLSTGLVGYWSFNGPDMSGTTAYDRSGNNNNGTLTNSPRRTSGRIGQALEFDGSNDEVDIGVVDYNLQSFTISSWAKLNTVGSPGAMFGYCSEINNGGFIFGYRNSTTFTMAFLGNDLDATITQDTSWHNFLSTYDASTKRRVVYRDGVEIGSDTSPSDITDVCSSVSKIGARQGSLWPFPGLIDEVRIYNRALSGDEIKRLYNMGSTLKFGKAASNQSLATGLVGYWSFNGPDMSGTTAYDRSGNNNNGTLTNNPVRKPGKLGQALDFDGVDDYVDIPYNSSLDMGTGDFSAFVWFYYRGGANLVPISTDYINWEIKITGIALEVNLGFDLGGPALLGGSVEINKWHFAGFTRTSGTGGFKLWLDGVMVDSDSNATDMNSANRSVFIGNRNQIGAPGILWWDGLIDEIRIYNRALTEQEIKRLYNMGK